MNITEERKKLQNIVENIKEVEAVANFDSKQWKEGRANIKRIDESISRLNVEIRNDKYLVGIDGKNKGNMLDFLKENFELNHKNSQNERYIVPSEKIEEVVKYYAGVKKENMEIEFRIWLSKQKTQRGNPFTETKHITPFCNTLRDIIPSWNNVEYDNLFNINDVLIIDDLYQRCRPEGDLRELNLRYRTGLPSNALNRYKQFLEQRNNNENNKQDKESKMSEQLQQTINLFKHKNQIILQGSPGTGKTRLAKEIAYHLILDGFLSGDEVERKKQLKELNNDNSKIGISKNINFSEYLKQGQELKTKSRKASFTIKNPKTRIGNVGIELTSSGLKRSINSENIIARINNEDWSIKGSGLEAYEIGIAEYIYNAIKEEKEIDSEDIKLDRYKLIQFHPAYSYEDFVRGIVATTTNGAVSYEVQNKVLAEMAQNADDNPNEKFVLIIDEINRANLAAVLGELIYALEYRGEVVESMYAIDGGNREIILPENLYIIGTMNTADRSVGHIDYAIRRRFAFVDVKTDEAVIPDNAKPLFKVIKKLFDEELSEEFDKDDVMIGHSYFLNNDLAMALEYEIKPILLEYVKDGVLTCNKEAITDLNVD